MLVVLIATSIPGGDTTDSGGSGASGGAAARSPPRKRRVRLLRVGEAPSDSAAKQAAPNAGDSAPAAIAPLPPEPGNPNADGRNRRYVERSAQIVIATPPRDIDRAAAKIIKVADDLGGFVVSSQVSSGSSGEFELRVPERRLQRALSRLSAVGKVRERTQGSQDVTGAVVSVEEPAEGRAHRAPQPAAPARQGDDRQPDHEHPRAAAPGLGPDRRGQARPAQRQAPRELLDDRRPAARRPPRRQQRERR